MRNFTINFMEEKAILLYLIYFMEIISPKNLAKNVENHLINLVHLI